MKIAQFILAGALVLGWAACAQPLSPPATSSAHWIAAWEFVPIPPPPGVTPALVSSANMDVPLGKRPFSQSAPSAPASPLLDNPGNVPVVLNPESYPSNVTVRQLVRVAVAGKGLRLRLTNEDSSQALMVGAVHVAQAGADGSVLPNTDHPVSFDGDSQVLVPAGAPLLSDPITMKVDALEKLIISIYLPGEIRHGGHALYQYVAGADGDQTQATQLPNQKIMHVTSLVSEVEVDPVSADAVVVALGDSITEGAQSTNNAFRSWPDRLAERLARSRWSVVNAGIGGNRLLRYGTGPSALARLDRDVLSVPGVKVIILLEGINDIGRGFFPPQEPVTAEALEAADEQIIARAHEHGIRVLGATLTPFRGAHYFTPEGETVRETYNQWIKSSGAFDGVIDFAPVVADPNDPTSFRADYNLRDKLHPNDAGYAAMADAVNLSLITGK